MFKGVKNLHCKTHQNSFIHDSEGKIVTDPKETHSIMKEHFQNHFNEPDFQPIEPFSGDPKQLNSRITIEQVTVAVRAMSNHRAPGYDNVAVELIKYAPECIHQEIAHILNDTLENHNDLHLGSGILAALWKPGKPKGPVKNLRPIILLTVLRKILSKIALARLKPVLENFISQSQCAYRSNRSTTDVIWGYRWIIAKVQEYVNLEIFVTGIDMTAAFDTINRQKLITLLSTIAEDDEIRMVRLLLSRTSIKIKVRGVNNPESFNTNVGSPQGDGISGPLYTLYFEQALRSLREAVNNAATSQRRKQQSDHDYARESPPTFPTELV